MQASYPAWEESSSIQFGFSRQHMVCRRGRAQQAAPHSPAPRSHPAPDGTQAPQATQSGVGFHKRRSMETAAAIRSWRWDGEEVCCRLESGLGGGQH